MCVLVDANAVHHLFGSHPVGELLMELIAKGDIHLVTGGKHKTEILKTKLRKIYRELILAGRLLEYPTAACEAEEKEFEERELRSDDPHILGLASISGCRVLFSYDEALCDDFRDPHILAPPRGKVLHKPHKHVINQAPACKAA